MNLYGLAGNNSVNKLDSLGLASSSTVIFGADAYGLVPWSLSGGFTWPIGVGFTVGGFFEVVFDCKDSTSEAFFAGAIGPSFGSPGPSLTYGKGLDFIYNLPTAKAYGGAFVAITGTAVGGPGVGSYGTGFTTPQGALNLATTGGFGGQTYGWGFGGAAGIPGVGISGAFQYFFDLGPLTFSSSLRSHICKCSAGAASATGSGGGGKPSQSEVLAAIQAELGSNSIMDGYKQDVKRKLVTDTVLGKLPSFLDVGSKIDQINWSMP